MSQTKFSPEVQAELDEYLCFKRHEEDLSAAALEALEIYAAEQRARLKVVNPDRPYKYLRITPAPQGSGLSDVSINHDKYLAEGFMEARRKNESVERPGR